MINGNFIYLYISFLSKVFRFFQPNAHHRDNYIHYRKDSVHPVVSPLQRQVYSFNVNNVYIHTGVHHTQCTSDWIFISNQMVFTFVTSTMDSDHFFISEFPFQLFSNRHFLFASTLVQRPRTPTSWVPHQNAGGPRLDPVLGN